MTNAEAAEMYAEATIAAILTLAVMPQSAAGHQPHEVVQRYRTVLDRLRAEHVWDRGLDEEQAGG
jgi:hypothetical protein